MFALFRGVCVTTLGPTAVNGINDGMTLGTGRGMIGGLAILTQATAFCFCRLLASRHSLLHLPLLFQRRAFGRCVQCLGAPRHGGLFCFPWSAVGQCIHPIPVLLSSVTLIQPDRLGPTNHTDSAATLVVGSRKPRCALYVYRLPRV